MARGEDGQAVGGMSPQNQTDTDARVRYEGVEERTRRLASFPQLNPSPVLEVDQSGKVTFSNPAAAKFLERVSPGADAHRLLPSDMDVILEALRQGNRAECYREVTIGQRVLGEHIYIAPEWRTVCIYATDITERRRAERERELSHRFLECTNRHREIGPLLNDYVEIIRNLTGCSAVGIRMRSQQNGVPCQAYDGSSPDSYRLGECHASLKGECLCTKLIQHGTDRPLRRRTKGGSFYVNRASRFRGGISGREILSTPVLRGFDCESVGIVPIRIEDRMLGVIYTADRQPNRLSPEIMRLLEVAAMQLAPVLERIQAEESLRRANDQLESRIQERTRELGMTNEKLQLERNRLRAMLDAMEDGVYIVSKEGVIEYVNPALARDFGSVQGRCCYQYLNDLNEPCSWCKNEEVFDGHSVRWEWTSGKTGKTYELFDTPIRNDNGTVSKVVIFHDITSRRQAKEALAESEDRYRTLVDTMGEGLAATDANFLLSYANERFCGMLGYSMEELIGRHASEIYDAGHLPALEQMIAQLKRGESQRHEVVFVRKDGGRIPVLVSPRPILDEQGRLKASFAVVADLTEWKKVEASLRESEFHLRALSFELLRAQEKERRRIARDLHDDLGQALTSAKLQMGYIRKKLPAESRELREECDIALGQLVQILEKVRTISRDLNPIIVEDLGFRAALQWLVDGFARLTEVRVSLSMDDIEPLISREAAVILYRVFQEILTNISKHAGAREVSVEIRRQEGNISFVVADNGRGFKTDEPSAGRSGGLGLLTMRERVHMLGGLFDLSSQSGMGTRLSFSIPITSSKSL